MAKLIHKTREGWLVAAAKELRPLFKKHKAPIPRKVQMGCGWPRGGKSEVIGQCFGKTWTSDGTVHIFISPTQATSLEVLAILVHELVHAAVGNECGHKGRFKEVARALGLEGPLTHTVVTAKSPLYPALKKIAKVLGKYPHSKMANKRKSRKGNPNWGRYRSVKLPGYTLTISYKVAEDFGAPLDPTGVKMVRV